MDRWLHVPTGRLDSKRASIGRMDGIEMHTGIWQILPPMRCQPPALNVVPCPCRVEGQFLSEIVLHTKGIFRVGNCHRKHMGMLFLQRLHDRLVASELKGAAIATGA